jgi:hypothetical protein
MAYTALRSCFDRVLLDPILPTILCKPVCAVDSLEQVDQSPGIQKIRLNGCLQEKGEKSGLSETSLRMFGSRLPPGGLFNLSAPGFYRAPLPTQRATREVTF